MQGAKLKGQPDIEVVLRGAGEGYLATVYLSNDDDHALIEDGHSIGHGELRGEPVLVTSNGIHVESIEIALCRDSISTIKSTMTLWQLIPQANSQSLL